MEKIKGMKLDDKLSQIRINQEDILKLRKKFDSLESLRATVIQLDQKTVDCVANLKEVKQSVDDIHTRFEERMELNHISTTKNEQDIV